MDFKAIFPLRLVRRGDFSSEASTAARAASRSFSLIFMYLSLTLILTSGCFFYVTPTLI